MTASDYRRMALGMADAVEREHMGHPDFRAPGSDGRIFATIHDDGTTGSLTLTPEQQQYFLREAPDAFFPAPGARDGPAPRPSGFRQWTRIRSAKR
jgi:hypothetical protein